MTRNSSLLLQELHIERIVIPVRIALKITVKLLHKCEVISMRHSLYELTAYS
jgi:hypothetical protein